MEEPNDAAQMQESSPQADVRQENLQAEAERQRAPQMLLTGSQFAQYMAQRNLPNYGASTSRTTSGTDFNNQPSSSRTNEEMMDTTAPFIDSQTVVAKQIEEAEECGFFQAEAERIREAQLRAEQAIQKRSEEANQKRAEEANQKRLNAMKTKKKKKKLDFTSGDSCPWCDKIFQGEPQRRIHQRTHGRNYHSDPEDDDWATLF